jgi:hypothetical protein
MSIRVYRFMRLPARSGFDVGGQAYQAASG